MTDDKKPSPEDRAKAFTHETRVLIMGVMKDGELHTPLELSKTLDLGLSHVAYHVERLEELGAIFEEKTEPRRGAVAHFYRTTGAVVPDDHKAMVEKIKAVVAGSLSAAKKLAAITDILEEAT